MIQTETVAVDSRSTVLTTSTAVTPTGYEGSVSVRVAGGSGSQISVAGGAWTTSTTIAAGQSLQVRTSSAGFSQTTSTNVTVGTGASSSFTVVTRAANATPAAYSIPNISGVGQNWLTTSTAVTPSGYETTASISVSGTGSPQISVGGSAFTTSTTISPATVNIGGRTAAFTVTTGAPACSGSGDSEANSIHYAYYSSSSAGVKVA